MKKLSIIVPIYNVENYLSRCLDSLLNQDILSSQYEIIIVNDGSIDNSEDIAKSYLFHHSNFAYYSQVKTGVGAARNLGIKQAKGQYLFFADADDYIIPDSLKELLNIVETNDLDVLRFNYNNVNEEGTVIPKKKNATKSIIFSEHIIDGKTFLSEQLGWACYAWSFVFKTSFLRNNRFIFDPAIYFEDVEWLLHVLFAAKRVRSVNKIVYCYVHRSGSITQSLQLSRKNKIITDKLFVISKLKRFAQDTEHKNVKQWCEGMISITFMGILAYVENEIKERRDEIINILRNNGYLPLKSYRFTLKQHRDLVIINTSPGLYCFLKRRK